MRLWMVRLRMQKYKYANFKMDKPEDRKEEKHKKCNNKAIGCGSFLHRDILYLFIK